MAQPAARLGALGDPWTPPGPGSYTLQARATDWAGRTQPPTVPFNTLGYLFWATVKQPVTVAS